VLTGLCAHMRHTHTQAFPNDRFMGEEDAQDLREDPALKAMTVSIAQVCVLL